MNTLTYGFASLLLVMALGNSVEVVAAADQPGQETRVMTFNIRYNNRGDGDNAWPHRKEQAAQLIADFDPDVLGLQEALHGQRDELEAALPQYSSVGGGRDADGGGECSPILYRRTRYDLLSAGMFWLSETPETRGSRSWGNTLPRMCTWAELFDRQTQSRIKVYNTHWDHQSQPARVGSGELIAERVREAAAAGEAVIVMGDFNVGNDNPARTPLEPAGLRDSYFEVHEKSEVPGTFHGFKGRSDSAKIDAILVTSPWKVVDAKIDRSEQEGRFPSDHFPVTAVLRLER